MPLPDWTRQQDYNVLYLGGVFVPCAVARVEVKLPSGLDIKKGKGKKKATITDDGDPPAEVDIEVDLLPQHLSEFAQKIIPLLRPQAKGAGRPPLEIAHPNTRLWGINVITPGEISSPMPASGGVWTISIKSHEWAPAPQQVKNKKDEKPKTDEEEWAHLKGGVTNFVREALNNPGVAAVIPPNLRALPGALLGLVKPSKSPASNL